MPEISTTNIYLKLTDIEGESQVKGHEGEMDIMSFSSGVSNPGSAGLGTGAGSTRANFGDMHFTKLTDKSSPALFMRAATGEHIKQAVLTQTKAGAAQGPALVFLKITLSDCLVSSFQQSGREGSTEENFSLNYAKIEVEYTPQSDAGEAGASSPVGFDVKAGAAI